MLSLSIDNFILLAHAGGGFRLDASRFAQEDLIRICRAAAAGREARVVIENARGLPIDDLLQIAVVARGTVTFED